MKKVISLLLAVVCMATLLAGCGAKTETPPQTANTQTVIDYIPPDLSGVKITQYMPTNTDTDPEKTWLNSAVEGYLGLDLEIIEADKLSTLLADMVKQWNLPDLVWSNGYSHESLGVYGEQGAFINIMKYLEAMPNVKAYLEDPANAATVAAYTYKKGEMYAIPVKQTGSAAVYTFLYRKDIFEKHNLQWPTNQEEFVAVLRKLKELYPNSQPFAMRNMQKNIQGAQVFGHLWGASHVVPGKVLFTLGEDGQYYLPQLSPAYKEMAQFWNTLMNEGLMAKSSMTMDTDGWYANFRANKCFITYDKVDRLPLMNKNGQTDNPDFLVVAGAPFNMGTYATQTDKVATSFAEGIASTAFMVGYGDNIGEVLSYIDWLYSPEGIAMTNWGVRGESYEIAADGTKYFKEGFIESYGNLNGAGLSVSSVCGILDFSAYKAACEPYLAEAITIAEQFAGKAPKQPLLPFTEDEQMTYITYAQGMYNYVCGEWYKFVGGERDFSEWEDALERAKSVYCYDDMIKIHQDAYARLQESET